MIDFNSAAFVKLSQVDPRSLDVSPLLVQNEMVVGAYKGIRDGVVITNQRIIAVNVQGMSGRKTDYTSLPFSKVQAFSVESAGMFDRDAELDLWFSGLGVVRFEFKGSVDIRQIANIIGHYVLR